MLRSIFKMMASPVIIISGTMATICSVMPFICGYTWTYGYEVTKIKEGLYASGISFLYVFTMMSLVCLAASMGENKHEQVSSNKN